MAASVRFNSPLKKNIRKNIVLETFFFSGLTCKNQSRPSLFPTATSPAYPDSRSIWLYLSILEVLDQDVLEFTNSFIMIVDQLWQFATDLPTFVSIWRLVVG